MSAVSTPTPTTRASSRTMAWGRLRLLLEPFRRAASISLIWPTTKPSRAMSRCSSAKVFGGSGMPSGVCSVARRSGALRKVGLKSRMPSRASVPSSGSQCACARRPGSRARGSAAWRPLRQSSGRGHAAMAPFAAQPAQEPALQQLGVEPVGLRPAMLPRYGDTRGMDHVRLDATRPQPARQPEAVAAGFEGHRNPRDRAAGPDRLIPPAMQQAQAALLRSASSFFSG